MGKYDFTTLPDRIRTNSYKWQESQKDAEVLPLWVADMDFEVYPEFNAALDELRSYQVYGYPVARESLYQAVIDWEKEQHGYEVTKEAIVFISGVVPAIGVAIQAFSKPGEAILINTPVYPPFARTVTLNQRQLVTNSLVERQGHFEIDFDQLEKDLVEQAVKVYVLCSPHNPGGRVWSEEELRRIGDLCRKHGVILVSDEIHQDLALFGHKHHSFNTLSSDFKDFTIVLSSATKTFNLAGIKNSFALIENPDLRARFQKQVLANNQHEISTLGLLGTENAFREGLPWLLEFKELVEKHVDLVSDRLKDTKIAVMKPEGTYLVWLDFSAYGLDHQDLLEKVRYEAKLVLNDGATFGKEGRQHLRLNVATPTRILDEALNRLVRVFENT
ncbi:MalY/PatB family protein [Streptococcus sp. DD12]|uniref:MalY/PatB family protein n=1 Tax=Streptococcus sp. DD12 TaxID=1777880 RepID=UPI00079565C4|nr:MalY/PatB family protein [Streptococcus sp. DD12]KXT75931.1 Aspartate aminotransferase [Streptococcus sp. DD12]